MQSPEASHPSDQNKDPGKPVISRVLKRAKRAFQLRSDAAFALLWTAITGAVLLIPLWTRGHRSGEDFVILSVIWLSGAFAGGFLARFASRFLVTRNAPAKRFAAMLFFLLVFTATFTAFLFMLNYRSYYAQWHEAPFSIGWTVQFIFTGANAVYLFIASALYRLATPPNMIAVLAICWFFKPAYLECEPR